MTTSITLERNEELVRQYFEVGGKRSEVYDEILHKDFVLISTLAGTLSDISLLKLGMKAMQASFPSMTFTILSPYVAEGDRVVVRYVSEGVHTGEPFTAMRGMKGVQESNSGLPFRLQGMAMATIQDGKIIEMVEEEAVLEMALGLKLVRYEST